jgi:diguanylate cyclase (GGDEF)-like protein
VNTWRQRSRRDAPQGYGRRALNIAAASLVLVGVLLTAFEFVLLHREFARSAHILARITAIHSAAPLAFGDAPAAQETLTALEVLPNLQAAAIFAGDGSRLAAYTRAGQPPIVTGHSRKDDIGWRRMVASVPIVAGSRTIGMVVGRFDLTPLYVRIAAFAGMYVLAGFGTMAIGLPLWWRMRKQVESAQERLTRLAHYDSTTGQLNRNAFNQDLSRCVESCEPGSRVGLLILDIDDFKDINDRFGHHSGDDLLNQFAARLGSIVRSSDRIYRLGGDEFAVLVQPLDSLDDIDAIATRIFAPFRTPITIDGHRLQASFSAGISLYPDDAVDIETLIAHADAAMYHAKRRGKNVFQRFEPRMTESTLRRLRLQEDLRDALATGESLEILYQPQFGRDGLEIEGMEALLRWRHPEFGPVAPAEFIPLAEDCGLVVPLGQWVLRTATVQMARWHAAGHSGLRLAVNMSVRQMQDPDLLRLIDEALEQTKLRPSALELEITESLLLEDAESNIRFMHALRERGIALAIDDFGKGYSSMSYLQRLPVNRLKIDMSFVHAIPGGGEAITTAITAMAHSLALTVIAEGVETTEQLEFLRMAGCDGLQGFLLAAPLSTSEASTLLAGVSAA